MSNAWWLTIGADCTSPTYRLEDTDSVGNINPLDLTDWGFRVEFWDAGHTGGSWSRGYWSGGPYPLADYQDALLTGTDLDGTLVVTSAVGGEFNFYVSTAQSRQLADRSWVPRRQVRKVTIRIFRTDGGRNQPLYDQDHWVHP